MPIEWNDSIKTGVKMIDDEHQDLIVMLNRLGRLKCGKEAFFEALGELEDYVNVHFKTEEEHMLKIKYPEYVPHKACHDKFIEGIKKFRIKAEHEKIIDGLGEKLFDFAGDWIIKHYSDEDIKLADFIKKNS